jgi:hypothetical protein
MTERERKGWQRVEEREKVRARREEWKKVKGWREVSRVIVIGGGGKESVIK